MKIRDASEQKKFDEYLKKLNFSQKNHDIAVAYLTGEQEDVSLLEQVEPVNFKQGTYLHFTLTEKYLDHVRRHDPERIARYYKLFWSMGKSTATFLLEPFWGEANGFDHDPDWRIRVLGEAPVAAMELERMALCQLERKRVERLHELARQKPEVLVAAQAMKGTPGDNMVTMAAALLLCHNDDAKRLEKQSAILLENNIDTLPTTLTWLSPAQTQELAAYIEKGDVHAPLPDFVPQPTAKNALMCRHGDSYLVKMLGLCSFLAIDRDPRAKCAFRIYININPHEVLYGVTSLGCQDHYVRHFDELLQALPGGKATMLMWLGYDRPWIDNDLKKQLMLRCASGVREALKYANANEYMSILNVIPGAKNLVGDEKEQICTLIDKDIYSYKQEVHDYLLGSGSLADSRSILADVSGISYSYPHQAAAMINLYRVEHGWDDFSCRCAVVFGIVFEGRGLENIITKMDTQKAAKIAASLGQVVFYGATFHTEDLQELIAALHEKELPLCDILTMTGYLHDGTYNEEKQKKIQASVYLTVAQPENIPELTDTVKKGTVFARQTAINALYNLAPDHPEAKAGVLAAAGDSSKQIKESLVTLYAGRPEWAEDYKKLLTAKKAAERLLAVQVLGKLGHHAELEAILASEKNAKVADAIRSILGAPQGAPVGSNDDLAANLLKGNKLKKLTWLIEQPLPKLRKTDGTDADENIRNAILVSYCELGRIGRSETAAQLAADIDAGDLCKLACEVYEHWYAAGAQTKHKWVLAFAAVYGGSTMTQRLKTAINDWPNHQRGAIACEAVMALALSPDPAALVIVDSISRKFKFRQVKQAAAVALENAAQELGITAEELADRIVPDLGFGKDGRRVFDYGKRSFTVRLTPTLELDIVNDQGKAVKNLPAPGKTDDPQAADAYEEFKNMKKQIKTTVTAQRARLESALSVLRCWDTDRWRALFVENPIMHQFAMTLIWGVYEDGRLTDTFRYMEDGSFNTVDEDEYELPENAKIGLVHPVELDEETLGGWKQQLEDYEITQSLDQLNRPVYTLDSAKAKDRTLDDFGGKQLNGLSLSGKLLGLGWYRGSVMDGGVFYSYYREDKDLGIGVDLRFSGSAVGFDDGEPVTVYNAVFYRGTVQRGSYIEEKIKDEDIIPLGDVPVRYYSEIIHHLNRATASSTETNEGWRNER